MIEYSKELLEHYENPKNIGSFDENDPNIGTGIVGSPACGDVMKMQIKVNDKSIVEDACFKTYGCGSAIASSSLATEWLKGKTIEEARAIKNIDIARALSLPPIKVHCSVLAEEAIEKAIENYLEKNGKTVSKE